MRNFHHEIAAAEEQEARSPGGVAAVEPKIEAEAAGIEGDGALGIGRPHHDMVEGADGGSFARIQARRGRRGVAALHQPDRDAVRGLAYMEALVRPLTWEEWPEAATRIFEGFRSPAGEAMVLEQNVFVERVLPGSILRELGEALARADLNRYPDPTGRKLRALIARKMGVPPGMEILLGNGSDDLIQIVTLTLARPGAVVLFPEPTFAMYRANAVLSGMRPVGVPDRKSTRLNSSHMSESRMPSSA